MELDRRDLLKAIGGVGVLAAGGSTAALSDPETEREFGLEYLENDDLLDNRELETILYGLADRHPDRVSVEQIGESNQGRPLYSATVSKREACPDVMVIAQQHGDEGIMAEGTLAALRFLAGGDRRAERILDGVSVHVVPRVNPDGFVARQRYNVDTDAPADDEGSDIFGADNGIFAASEEGIGWDINRYNRHEWTEHELYQNFPEEYPENPVPEARAIIDRVGEVEPDWIADFHRQGEYVVDYESEFDLEAVLDEDNEEEEATDYPPDPDDPGDGDIVTGSIFWPINPDVEEGVRDRSKQVVYTMYDALSELDGTNYTRYPGGTFGGIARNGHALAGYGSVLFELSAGTLGDREFRIRQVFEAVLASAHATADGSLDDVDPEGVDELPERGDSFTV
ncbi:M14 family zinc carboxypeptidase [Halalkalicoccus jeotgali]|uniref:Peptidase M14, carboxypeptidase A n=1 Tax=Halalkalicoccus jeotgali (strain DSM 18796 / CECT 7217 / JCM 14584 / KCTC 4019 / B3) TaxID=795797 RepID=D8J3Z2_HALJB|nr:M14 family zinc carboxypeptidase [Halalkalicoccus jeotgali]ADJ15384.1 peptidase M14, carboxypeptidase A [Halalkalicoccus jeotgali B3]ELY35724.1 peptidase M14, carboxypeptidase A [Halalkalicoccus jeotgali B3]